MRGYWRICQAGGAVSRVLQKRETMAPPFGKASDSTLPFAGDAVAIGWIALGESHFPFLAPFLARPILIVASARIPVENFRTVRSAASRRTVLNRFPSPLFGHDRR